MNPLLAVLGVSAAAFAFSRTDVGSNVVASVADTIGGRLPRGIRNNNPGNIDWIADPAKRWRGMVRQETKAEGGRFAVFDSAANGVRAIAQELLLDERRGIRTIAGLVSSWAPSTENDTGAYVASVARRLKIAPDQRIDVGSWLPRLVAAIIEHENGQQPYSETDLSKWVKS